MTYAARFNGFSGERFETLGERPGPRETVLVDTRIVRPDAPAVPITYVMTEQGGTADHRRASRRSISELAVRRSEYNQVLRNGGTERLAETSARSQPSCASPEPARISRRSSVVADAKCPAAGQATSAR